MRGKRIGYEADRTNGSLDSVKQGETGEHAHGQRMLGLAHCAPDGQIIGDGYFLRQPKIAGQPVPYLKVLVILKFVPVDGTHTVNELNPLPRYGYRCHDGHPF